MEFDYNGARCFGCREPFNGAEAVWLAESDREIAHPFHRACADQPWPLSEVDGPQQTVILVDAERVVIRPPNN